MPRVQAILERLPAHFEANKPGKVLGTTTAALARDLDVQSASLAAIRRAHRLFEADEMRDLMLIAARHGIDAAALALLAMRFQRADDRLAELKAAAGPAARNQAAEQLLELWGLAGAAPRLARFFDPPPPASIDVADPLAPSGDVVDLTGQAAVTAVDRVQAAAVAAQRRSAHIAAARTRIATTIRIHANGNGTVAALLAGAANALDLDIGEIKSSADRYLHASFAFDRLRLRAETATGALVPAPAREVIGLEENPIYREQTDAVPRSHAELFDQLRRGFERATLQIRVTGEGERTIGPMVVNRDEGHGVGYAGAVAAGETLVFEEGGRVKRGADDVTAFAYAWRGGCFGDGGLRNANDYVFATDAADKGAHAASFAVATPAGALDRDFVFPHAGGDLPMPGVSVGRTRFAFFVQEAHHSLGPTPPVAPQGRRVAPRPAVGFLDGSVFAPGPGQPRTASASVSFSWLERRAYLVRVLIPPRFRALEDDAEAPEVRRRLAEALRRFKPAGVALEVAFLDDRWTLGEGVLGSADADDPVAALRGGMSLWAAPE